MFNVQYSMLNLGRPLIIAVKAQVSDTTMIIRITNACSKKYFHKCIRSNLISKI